MTTIEPLQTKQPNLNTLALGTTYTYCDFFRLTERLVANKTTTGPVITDAHIAATKLNLQRMNRLNKTIQLQPEWATVKNAEKRFKWILISEPWCGDGSQITPVISKIAEKLGIQLEIILRDEHPVIIDIYKFRGTLSIPKLLCFDLVTGVELGNWGPRPAAAQELVDKARAAGIAHDDYMISLQNWYNQDKTISLQSELFSFVNDCLQ